MANVMLEISDGFSLVWFLMYRHSKSTFLQVILNWSQWTLVVDILPNILILLTLLTFIALPILRKNINLSKMVSLWCELFCKLSIYTLKSNQWIITWYGEKHLNWNVYYWYSFTPIQTSKSLAKMPTLNGGTSELIPKKNRLKLLILH